MEKLFGTPLPNWTPPPRPVGEVLTGAYVQLERMDPALHGADLHRAYQGHDGLFDYLPYGPFALPAGRENLLADLVARLGALEQAIRDQGEAIE